MKKIAIHTDYITLGQFLKLSDCIQTGGQAKPFLEEHEVYINGELDQRRGKKLVAGDTINIKGFGQFRIEKKD